VLLPGEKMAVRPDEGKKDKAFMLYPDILPARCFLIHPKYY
jgi:hypothetical protein